MTNQPAQPEPSRIRRHPKKRAGAALLMSLFVIMFVTIMVVNIYDTETLQLTTHRNVIDYERALYLAGAAVHHAASELENNIAWRGTITDGSFPASDTYQATAIDGAGNTVLITGEGVSGSISRRLSVTITQSN